MTKTLENFLQTAKSRIDGQFKQEMDDLLIRLNDGEGYPKGIVQKRWRLATAALRLRKLSAGVRAVDLTGLLCQPGDPAGSTYYSNLMTIADPHEYMRVPRALCNFVRDAEYDILDDGYVRLVRVTLRRNGVDAAARYFLSEQPDPNMQQIRTAIENTWWYSYIYPIRVGEMELLSFDEDLDKFSEFIEILADNENWKNRETMSTTLDRLMLGDKNPPQGKGENQ